MQKRQIDCFTTQEWHQDDFRAQNWQFNALRMQKSQTSGLQWQTGGLTSWKWESNGFKHTKAVVRKNNREKMANRCLKSVKLTFRWINRMKLAVW